MPATGLFAVRYSFLCPICKNAEDGELIVIAITGEDALRQVRARTLTCDFCSAEIPPYIGTFDVEAA